MIPRDISDLCDHLRAAAQQQQTVIKPKGLRSFDASDADFFLELLPGARDRHGLPESIAFWKQRIEARDAHDTFTVGLIYGPSGCGKSSLVKAGLLPRLAQAVGAEGVVWNRDVEPYGRSRDGRVTAAVQAAGLRAEAGWDQLLVPPEALKTGGGDPYRYRYGVTKRCRFSPWREKGAL